ncbi:MAG: hypothetical protein KGI52_08450 [Burkholderiales bacterium]|nr:hypothetical protein [Burkholderiales bacterium]
MKQCVVYELGGNTHYVWPAPDGLHTLEHAAAIAVPDGVPYLIIDESQVPAVAPETKKFKYSKPAGYGVDTDAVYAALKLKRDIDEARSDAEQATERASELQRQRQRAAIDARDKLAVEEAKLAALPATPEAEDERDPVVEQARVLHKGNCEHLRIEVRRHSAANEAELAAELARDNKLAELAQLQAQHDAAWAAIDAAQQVSSSTIRKG